MARKVFFAFLVLFSLAFCEAKAENCSEVQCKIFSVGEDLPSEFRNKASEKGVRLVYINLIIGNATYDPLDLPDEFLPHRWVWANTIKEPMLTLPDDYDILSIGLLNNQVRSMDVKLEDKPSGCLANLNSTCQNMAVGRMLLENVTIKSTGEKVQNEPVVCVEVIKTEETSIRDVDYQCCGRHQGPTGRFASIRCDQTVDIGSWMEALNTFFTIFSGILSLFLPALPLALPDWVFSLRAECEKENRLKEQNNNTETPGDHQNIRNFNGTTDELDNPSADELSLINGHSSYQQVSDSDHDASNPRENISEQIEEESETIPVDDSSPMNLSTLLNGCAQKLPDMEMSFNIKLAIMLLCICPSVLYVQIGLYRTVKKIYVNESIKKDVEQGLSPVSLRIVGLDLNDTNVMICFVVLLSTIIVPLLSLRPGDFIMEQGVICFLCKNFNSGGDFLFSDRRSVADELRRHLEILNHYVWHLIRYFGNVVVCDKYNCSYSCTKMRHKSRFLHIICVLLCLISFSFSLLLRVFYGAIIFVGLLVASLLAMAIYSPYSTFFLFLYLKILLRFFPSLKSVHRFLFFLFFYPVLFCLFFGFLYVDYFMIVNSCLFVASALGYTIMGLVLNVGIVAPYAAFLVVLSTNLYLCYSNMQNKYKEVKKMILKRKEELQVNSRDPKDTVQAELYWYVCDKVLPIKTEICVMFRNMGLVLLFLFLVAYSIAFFGKEYDVSFVTSTMYVFFSGAIPPLVLKRLTNSDKIIGWARIKMERQIGIVVEEYRDSSDAGVVTQSPV